MNDTSCEACCDCESSSSMFDQDIDQIYRELEEEKEEEPCSGSESSSE